MQTQMYLPVGISVGDAVGDAVGAARELAYNVHMRA